MRTHLTPALATCVPMLVRSACVVVLQQACTLTPTAGSPARRGPYGEPGLVVVVVVVVDVEVVVEAGDVVVVVGEPPAVGTAVEGGGGGGGGAGDGPHAASTPHPRRIPRIRHCGRTLATVSESAHRRTDLTGISDRCGTGRHERLRRIR